MHAGGHGTIPADWGIFLDFMKLHFKPYPRRQPWDTNRRYFGAAQPKRRI